MQRAFLLAVVVALFACGEGVQSNPGRCDDGQRNGNETDTDCGGGSCVLCEVGRGCMVARDCASNVCSMGSCVAPPVECTDGTKSVAETDVDCGGGTCPACVNGKSCQLKSDCQSNFCDGGRCAVPPQQCVNGTQDGTETDVDCGGGTCTPCGNGKSCQSAIDCQSNSCVARKCVAPPQQCSNGTKDGSESDIDCGGGTCAACGNGKACSSRSDCQSNTCTANVCAAPPQQCLNATKDGAESDVDCGGGSCPACVNGKACRAGGDCMSGTCVNLVCSTPAPSCGNGMKDATETDVDCGGGCPPCVNGKSCNAASDCMSTVCSAHVCSVPAPQCSNGTKDSNETDIDCGGSTCASCIIGKQCSSGSDCISGFCPGGICAAPSSGCSNGVKDGDESDIDCGGRQCPACVDGKACTRASDCRTNLCTANVCTMPVGQCADGVKNGAETDVDCGGGSCPVCAFGKHCLQQRDCAFFCDTELRMCTDPN